jgi:hypothetical protein
MDTGSMEAAVDATGTQDTSSPVDAHEASTADAGGDAPADGPVDSGVAPEGSSPDAPFDSGCGPLNTTTNCSACGDKCASVAASETASTCPGDSNGFGATCSYTCAASHLDCNAGTAPDLDGCECATPGVTNATCCSGACPIAHDYDEDIINTTFYDCVAASTYNLTVAMDACTAYAGAGQCDVMGTYFCTLEDGGMAGDMVCSDGAGAAACACWGYDGLLLGQMVIGPGKAAANPNNCECPEPTDPKWK